MRIRRWSAEAWPQVKAEFRKALRHWTLSERDRSFQKL
jgi:hypothetical protein